MDPTDLARLSPCRRRRGAARRRRVRGPAEACSRRSRPRPAGPGLGGAGPACRDRLPRSLDRGLPRTDRAPRWAAERVRHRDGERGARGGAPGGAEDRGRRLARPPARHSDRRQGQHRHRRHTNHRGQRALRAPGARRGRRGGEAPAERRRGLPRQAQPPRGRDGFDVGDQPLRRGPQSVGRGAHRRRLLRGHS